MKLATTQHVFRFDFKSFQVKYLSKRQLLSKNSVTEASIGSRQALLKRVKKELLSSCNPHKNRSFFVWWSLPDLNR